MAPDSDAQEAAWREDARRVSNGDQVHGAVRLALAIPTIGRFLRLLAACTGFDIGNAALPDLANRLKNTAPHDRP